MMMTAPIKIAAGAAMLATVSVVGVVSYTSNTAAVSTVQPETSQSVSQTAQTTQAPAQDSVAVVTDEPEVSSDAPRFDLVRVDGAGSAVVAGNAAPGSEIAITLDGAQFTTVEADSTGAFVALFQIPTGEAATTVGLEQLRQGAGVTVSVQTVLVVPPPKDVEEAVVPTIVLADETGVDVLQGGAQSVSTEGVSNPLSLDTISYDDSGAVVLAGQGESAQFVRVYMNNEPVQTELVPDDGQWRVVLPDVDQGLYTLRVDEIDAAGAVQARVESPFQRANPETLKDAAVTQPDKSRVVVQPGHTLWELAESTYGDGVKYVQIFHANKDTIRDANLIYPGQIFKLPE